MAAKDVLADLQKKAQDQLDKDKQQQSGDQNLVDQLASLQKQYDDESAAAGKAQYNQGFQDGLAKAGADGEKVFTLEDLNQKLADATKPLQDNADSLQSQLDARAQEVDRLNKQMADQKDASEKAAAAVGAKMAKLVADLKADIAAKIRSVDINNENLANQLAAEANAPTPVVDQDGKPVAPPVDQPPKVEPVAPVQDAPMPTVEVQDDPLAPATVSQVPSADENADQPVPPASPADQAQSSVGAPPSDQAPDIQPAAPTPPPNSGDQANPAVAPVDLSVSPAAQP